MNSVGQSLLHWLGAMTLATGAVLLLALIADRALERRVSAAVRLLLYVAVLARLGLPAGWTSPLGLLGGWSAAPAPEHVDVGTVSVEFLALAAPPTALGSGAFILIGWLLVSLALLIVWAQSRVRLRRQLRATVAAGTSDSGIPVLQHPVLGPLVAGAWRARIVVPEALVSAPDREPLRWVLRHESAHVQRRDPLLSSVVQVICLLAWPVVPIWIAARRIRTLMEIACDERAVANEDGAGRRRYGEVLLALAAGAPGQSPLAGALSFASPLRGRLRALVPRRRWPVVVQAAVVAALGALAVACAGGPGADDGSVEVGGNDLSDVTAEVPVASVGLSVPALSLQPGMQVAVFRFGAIGATAEVAGYPGLGLGMREWRASLERSMTAPVVAAPAPEQRWADRLRPSPPILTVTRQGELILNNRVVTPRQLEDHLALELRLSKQDTLLVRGHKDNLVSPDVMAIAKRAGAKQIGILASEAPAPITPAVTPSAPVRDTATSMNVVKAHTADVKGCYEQALRRGLVTTSGRAEIRLGIDRDGRVSRDGVVVHGFSDGSFQACLGEKMRAWRFPASSSPSEVAFPFIFHSAADASRMSLLGSAPAVPTTPPPKASSAGEMDPALVAKEVRGRMPEVRRCYEAALVRAPKLAGRLELKFTIEADGRLSRPSLAVSTLNDGQVENCLLELARTWTFAPPEGGPVEVSFPFVFSSSK